MSEPPSKSREYPPPRGMGSKACDNCGSTEVHNTTQVGGWFCGGCGWFVFEAKEETPTQEK